MKLVELERSDGDFSPCVQVVPDMEPLKIPHGWAGLAKTDEPMLIEDHINFDCEREGI